MATNHRVSKFCVSLNLFIISLARYGHTATLVNVAPFFPYPKLYEHRMAVCFGRDVAKKGIFKTSATYYNEVWVLDIQTLKWELLKLHNFSTNGRSFHSACYIDRACILLFGGEAPKAVNNIAFIVDIVAKKAASIPYLQTMKKSWPTNRRGHAAFFNKHFKTVMITGGERFSEQGLKEVPGGMKDICSLMSESLFAMCHIGSQLIAHDVIANTSTYIHAKPGKYKSDEYNLKKVDKYTNQIIQNPKNLTELLEKRCTAFLLMRSYSKAIEDAKKLHSVDPNKEQYAKQVCYCYFRMGDYEKSLELYEIVKKIALTTASKEKNVSYLEAYVIKAKVLTKLRRYEKAIETCENILKICNSSAPNEKPTKQPTEFLVATISALKWQATNLSSLRKYDKGIEILDKLSTYITQQEPLQNSFELGHFINKLANEAHHVREVKPSDYLKYEKSKVPKHIAEVKKVKNTFIFAQKNLEDGREALKQGNQQLAITLFTRAHVTDTTGEEQLLELVKVLIDARDFISAAQYSAKLIEINSTHMEIYGLLAKSYVLNRKIDLAIETIEKALAIAKSVSVDAKIIQQYEETLVSYQKKREVILQSIKRANSAKSLADSGSVNEAIAEYTKAIELDNENADFYTSRALLYSKTRQTRAAIDDCEKAIKLSPEMIANYIALAQVYVTAYHYTRAKVALEMGLQKDLQHPQLLREYKVIKELLRKKAKAEILSIDARDTMLKNADSFSPPEKLEIFVLHPSELTIDESSVAHSVLDKLNKSVELYAKSKHTLVLRARCHYALHEFGKCITDIRSVFSVFREDQEILTSEQVTSEVVSGKQKEKIAGLLNTLYDSVIVGAKALTSMVHFDEAIALLDKEYPTFAACKDVQADHKAKIQTFKQQVVNQFMPIIINFNGYMKQGRSLKKQKKYKESIEQFQKAIAVFNMKTTRNVHYANAFFETAETFILNDQADEAINYIAKAIQQDATMPQFYSVKTIALIKQKKYSEALDVVEEALRSVTPRNVPLNAIWMRLKSFTMNTVAKQMYDSSKKMIEAKMSKEALPLARGVIKFAPSNLSARIVLANCLYHEKYLTQCLDQCNYVLRQFQSEQQYDSVTKKKTAKTDAENELEISALRYAGLANIGLRHIDDANQVLLLAKHKCTNIYKLDPSKVTRDYESGQKIKDKVNIAASYIEKGDSAAKNGKFDKAISLYQLAIENDNENPLTYVARAKMYYEKSDLIKTVADCDTALNLDRGNMSALKLKVQCLVDMQKFAEAKLVVTMSEEIQGETFALDDIKEMIENHESTSKETDVNFEEAKKLIANGEFDEGESLLEDIRSKQPYNAKYLVEQIKFLMDRKKAKEAKKKILALAQLEPDNVMAYEFGAKFYTEFVKDPFETLLNVVEGLCIDKNHVALQQLLSSLLDHEIDEVNDLNNAEELKSIKLNNDLDEPFVVKYTGSVIQAMKAASASNASSGNDGDNIMAMSDLLSDDDLKMLDDIEKPEDETVPEHKPKEQAQAVDIKPKEPAKEDDYAKQLLGSAFSFVKSLITLVNDVTQKKKSEAYLYIVKAYNMFDKVLSEAELKQLKEIFSPDADSLQKPSTKKYTEGIPASRQKVLLKRFKDVKEGTHPFYKKNTFAQESYNLWQQQESIRLTAVLTKYNVSPAEKLEADPSQKKTYHEDMINVIISFMIEKAAEPQKSISPAMLDIIYFVAEAYGYDKCYVDIVTYCKYAFLSTRNVSHGSLNAYRAVCLLIKHLYERKANLSNNPVGIFLTKTEFEMFDKGYTLLQPNIDAVLTKHYRCMTNQSIEKVIHNYYKIGALCHFVRSLSKLIPATSYSSLILNSIQANQQNAITVLKNAIISARGSSDCGYLPYLLKAINPYLDDYDSYFPEILPRIDYMYSVASKMYNIIVKELYYHATVAEQIMKKTGAVTKIVPFPPEILTLHEIIVATEDSLKTYLQDEMESFVPLVDNIVLAYVNVMIHNEENKLRDWISRAVKLDDWKGKKHPVYADKIYTSSVVDMFDMLQAALQNIQSRSNFLIRTFTVDDSQNSDEGSGDVTETTSSAKSPPSQLQIIPDEADEDDELAKIEDPFEKQKHEYNPIEIQQAQDKSNLLLIYVSLCNTIQSTLNGYCSSLMQIFRTNLQEYAKNNEHKESFSKITLILGNVVVTMDQMNDLIKELKANEIEVIKGILERISVNLTNTLVVLQQEYLNNFIRELVHNLFFKTIQASITTIVEAKDQKIADQESDKIFDLLDKYLTPFAEVVPNKEVFIPMLRSLFELIVELMKEKVVLPTNKPKVAIEKVNFLNVNIVQELESYFYAGGQGLPKDEIDYHIMFLSKLFHIASSSTKDLCDHLHILRNAKDENVEASTIWNSPEERAILINYILHFIKHNATQEKDNTGLQVYQQEANAFTVIVKEEEAKTNKLQDALNAITMECNEIEHDVTNAGELLELLRKDYRVVVTMNKTFMRRIALRATTRKMEISMAKQQSRKGELNKAAQSSHTLIQSELNEIMNKAKNKKIQKLASNAVNLLEKKYNEIDDEEKVKQEEGFKISEKMLAKFSLSHHERLVLQFVCANVKKGHHGTFYVFSTVVVFESQTHGEDFIRIPLENLVKISKIFKTFEDDTLVFVDKDQHSQVFSGIKGRDAVFKKIVDLINAIPNRTVELKKDAQIASIQETIDQKQVEHNKQLKKFLIHPPPPLHLPKLQLKPLENILNWHNKLKK